jgi:hypothetical protein
MPVIFPILGVRDTQSEVEDTTSSLRMWIIAAVVAGIILVGVTLAFVLSHQYNKRRRYRRVQALEPSLTRDEFFKKRRMTAAEMFREEEERRRHIIRKSLASRSSTHSLQSESSAATVDRIHREVTEMERQRSIRLKEDWKRWEARERRERIVSGGTHPAASAAGGVPILAIPSPAKHRSQGRVSQPSSPPVPPRHPGRRSSS